MAKKKVAKVEKVVKVEEAIKQSTSVPHFFSKKILVVVVVAVLLVLGFYKKDWLVAATVNGSPITTLELMSRMSRDYKAQALDQVISEKIILAEAKNKGVQINKQEVDGKLSEVEQKFGGQESFSKLLAQQGQTRDGFKEQVLLQLIVEKLYSNEATVSAEEVDSFIKESASSLQATDSAKQKEEAENVLRQQKLSQIFSQKFQELKQQAKIQIF